MKEKTFEELIDGKGYGEGYSVALMRSEKLYKKDIINLMKQVREATIAECVEILTNPNIPKSRMVALKTDRIKLTNENAN